MVTQKEWTDRMYRRGARAARRDELWPKLYLARSLLIPVMWISIAATGALHAMPDVDLWALQVSTAVSLAMFVTTIGLTLRMNFPGEFLNDVDREAAGVLGEQ